MELSIRSVRRSITALAMIASLVAPARVISQQTIPAQLTDSAFWKLVVECSEPNGYFQSDNLLSNELSWQYVIPRLLQTTKPGGIYLGVGPEQNYTYIAAIKPSMAIIFDIRRGNMLMHLMYKGMFELSPTRGEYLSRLFSRPKPAGFDTVSSVNALFQGIASVPYDQALYSQTLDAMKASYARHGFALSADDWGGIASIMTAMASAGPMIDYNVSLRGGGGRGGSTRPNYGMLMVADDGAGVQRSYLANDVNFRLLKEMHAKNLIVPLVGDFAGPKAIRSVADYLRAHNATVQAIYTSNVEQYLFQQGDAWSRYYTNVAQLPIDPSTTFIRSYFSGGGSGLNLLNPVSQLLSAFQAGRIASYLDVINMSK